MKSMPRELEAEFRQLSNRFFNEDPDRDFDDEEWAAFVEANASDALKEVMKPKKEYVDGEEIQ